MCENYATPSNHAVAACSGKIIQPHHLPKTVLPVVRRPARRYMLISTASWQTAGWRPKVQTGASYKQLNAEVGINPAIRHLMQHFDQKPTGFLARDSQNRTAPPASSKNAKSPGLGLLKGADGANTTPNDGFIFAATLIPNSGHLAGTSISDSNVSEPIRSMVEIPNHTHGFNLAGGRATVERRAKNRIRIF